MSQATHIAERPVADPAPPPAGGSWMGLVRADIREAWSARAPRVLLLVGIGLGLATPLLTVIVAHHSSPLPGESPIAPGINTLLQVSATTVYIFFALFATVATTGAFSGDSIVYELLAWPRRLMVFLARAVAVAFWTLLASLVTVLLVTVIGLVNHSRMSLTNSDVHMGFGGSVLTYLLLQLGLALFGLGLAMIFRHTAAGVLMLMAVLFVVPIVGAALNAASAKVAEAILANALASSAQVVAVHSNDLGVSYRHALIALIAWIIAALGFGFLRFTRYVPR